MENKKLELLSKDELLKQFNKILGGGVASNLIQNEYSQKEDYEVNERFRLNWVGENYSIYLANVKTETFIAPDKNHNDKIENKNTENSIIIGDNLDVLKYLKEVYTNKIKMIYIDPPYNTGNNDFVYKDKFSWTDEEYAEKLNITDDEIKMLRSLEGKSSHSAWLTFMYPRLKLAKDLLSDDGVIFISIDDNEQANLKLICDRVFGEGNFVACFIRNIPDGANINEISINHEYILCYKKKNRKKFNVDFNKDDKIETRLTNSGNTKSKILFKKGLKAIFNNEKIFSGIIGGKSEPIKIIGEMKFNNGELLEDVELEAEWRMPDILNKLFNNEKVFDDKGQEYSLPFFTNTGVPHLYKTRNNGIFRSVQTYNNNINELRILFDNKKVFDNPKPVKMIKDLIKLSTKNDDIILDFFAGSGTTAEAVMQLNAEDGGNRKFILVQLPEKIDKKKEEAYNFCIENNLEPLVSNICIERVKRASEKIKNENSDKINQDFDFKIYHCKDIDFMTADKLLKCSPNQEDLFDDMITPFKVDELNASGVDSLLQTWLINDGFAFGTKIDELSFDNGKIKAFMPFNGKQLYIFDWNSNATMELLNKIGKNELNLNQIVLYVYNIDFTVMLELKNNIKSNINIDDSKNVKIIERY